MPSGLGRGLSSLIPSKPAKNKENNSVKVEVDSVKSGGKDRVLRIDPKKVKKNPNQPRREFEQSKLEELANSIREHGVIQPIVITIVDSGDYELIAGERRLRASILAGLDEIPAIIRDANEQQKLELALIENIQREDLNPIDTGLAYSKLMEEFGLDQEEVATRVGKAGPSISNTMRMLRLPEEIQDALRSSKIGEGHAKYIVGLDNEIKQVQLFRKIIHNNMTVRDTAKESRIMGGTKRAKIKVNYSDEDREVVLREFFGTKVKIERKKKGGDIIVSFCDDEELEGIINRMK